MDKKSFKEKGLKQKLQYLWDYYRFTALAAIALVILAVYLVIHISAKNDDDAYCLIMNDIENNALAERIKKGFPAFLNNNTYSISVDIGYPFTYLEEHGINWPDDASNINMMQVVTFNKADVVIADYETLLWAVYAEIMPPLDLQTILPVDLLDKLEPYFVYAYFPGEDESDGKVYGLHISETAVYKGYSHNYENAIVFIPNLTNNPEIGINFIKYLFDVQE